MSRDTSCAVRNNREETAPEALVRMFGVAVTRELVDNFPGQRLYVPATYGPDNPLAAVLGEANFRKLIAEFAGDMIALPTGRAEFIRAAILEGLSANRIAALARCSRRTVMKYRAELKAQGHTVPRPASAGTFAAKPA